MNHEDYAEQERSIREGIHRHDGIWWRRSSWQCCQPLYPLQEIEPGSGAPGFGKALVRYWHVVPRSCPHNLTMTRMLIQGDRLRSYGEDSLERRRRQAINRAIRHGLAVRRIESLEGHWSELLAIFVSTAERTRYGLSERYYVENETEWRRSLTSEFALPGRDWFGVFHGDRLVAYMYSCMVEDTAILLVTKSNAEYHRWDPNDLLFFQVIQHYRKQSGCMRVDAGWATREPATLDWRKVSLGFERVELGAFQRVSPGVRALLRGGIALGHVIYRDSSSEGRRGLRHRLGVIADVVRRWESGE